MASQQESYLLASGTPEMERLRLQARVWEPEAEAMLARMSLPPRAACVDLGCGAMGILGPLSHKVGMEGRVLGIDVDPVQLEAARAYVNELGASNVEIIEGDAYQTDLPDESFDLVHTRFVFAPVGRDDELLDEMVRLTRPGGVIAIQEPDSSSWNCFPSHPAWDRLKEAILAAFRGGGGDFNAGRRTYQMLCSMGINEVQIRAAIMALPPRHPYRRLPVQFVTSLRPRILNLGLLTEAELDEAVAECEQIVADTNTIVLTFALIQTWGIKPPVS